MPAEHRENEVTRTTVHRVYRLGEGLRRALSARRKELGMTLRAFLADAVESELPALVEVLRAALPTPEGETRPARLPLTDALLGLLRRASGDTGVPAAKLLAACVTRAAARKRRRRSAPPERATAPSARRRKPGPKAVAENGEGMRDHASPPDSAA
jgi:hypothetical protein